MISSTHAQMMAAYNRWQNEAMYGAADSLNDGARHDQRGAFFGSIHGTLSHILWADHIWLSRFDMRPPPPVKQAESPRYISSWAALMAERADTDALIEKWAGGLTETALAGELRWYSGSVGRETQAPTWVVVTHLFNHQTHHRGQVHAMLTAARAKTADTDLFLMPSDRWPKSLKPF